MAARIGIDTGGTFTDIVRWSRHGVRVHKLPSTPDDPARAVLAGIAAVRTSPGEAVDVVHGTTVGLNAVLTGALARTVFVTNRGCEDLIEIGRQERADLYSFAPHRATPPVPRGLRVGVDCRRGPGGVVDRPLRASTIARTVAAVARLRPEAIAIGLLHSPANPADERALASALRRAMPSVPVTASAELLPANGEYERFCAAILNAAIAPIVGHYTARLARDVGNGRLRLLRSSLGILPPAEAARFPARAVFSGPAGGVLAAARLTQELGWRNAAAFDMGGTSADVCLVETPMHVHDAGAIAGLPLPLPTVPVHTVGCGGGSVAWADAGGALRVGPRSAGAEPGPACYGKGDEPTVTDAHVALGHLGPETLLGGAFPIDVDAAVRAIERLGRRVGLSAVATARGILTIADVTMARAILVITAERAIDPATVPLIAYGGAGGLHAAGLIARLGMPHAIVPPMPGAFSALGLALAGETTEHVHAVQCSLDRRGRERLAAIATKLARAAQDGLEGRGRTRVQVLLRYRGQGTALALPFSRNLEQAFHREHHRRYGFTADAPIEAVRVMARGEARPRALPLALAPAPNPAPARARRRPPVGGPALAVFARQHLRGPVVGPAMIEETTATTRVPLGFVARQTTFGLTISRAQ